MNVRPPILALTLAAGAPAAAAPFEGLDFHIYSDVNATVDTEAPPRFSVGGVNFFATQRVDDRIKLLSENVLEILGEDGTVFDLERLYVDVRLAPELNLRMGREHLPVGYYSQTFHHALLYQLTASRPVILSFEDDGGMLPAHVTGLLAYGDVFANGSLPVRYTVSIGNGRGQFADDVLSTFDRNPFKSLSARVVVLPASVYGLEIGVSGYYDLIPAGFSGKDHHGTPLSIDTDIREIIGSAHVVYRAWPVDIIAEGYVVRHEEVDTGTTTSLAAAFLQAGLETGTVTPYVRTDYVQRDANDAFFNASHADHQLLSFTGGVRVTLQESVQLKMEGGGDVLNTTGFGTVQLAFGM